MSNAAKKRGLGRGLDALIVSTEPEPAMGEAEIRAGDAGVRSVEVGAISPNPRQPRTRFSDDALDELAASIRAHGIIQPLVLTVDPRAPGRYWLVAGERRWRAAQRAGVESVPALVRDASPQELVELALIENLQRADLNALEEAAAYQSLIEEFRLTQAEVADRVGRSRSAVANTVRLLGLPPQVQDALANESITAGHPRALLALPAPAAMEVALQEITRKGHNVRQTEALVKRMVDALAAPPAPAPVEDPALRAQVHHMEERFRTALGTRVSLNRNADGSGRLVVHFYNDDDLEAIYQIVAGGEDDE